MESSILINFFNKFLRKLMDYFLMCSLDSMEVENRNLLLMEPLELIFFKITVKKQQFINLMMKNLTPQIIQEGMLDKLVHKESEKVFYLGNALQDKWQLICQILRNIFTGYLLQLTHNSITLVLCSNNYVKLPQFLRNNVIYTKPGQNMDHFNNLYNIQMQLVILDHINLK